MGRFSFDGFSHGRMPVDFGDDVGAQVGLDAIEKLLGDSVELGSGLLDGFQCQGFAMGFIDDAHE
jgi:hypothetical protein